MRFWLLATLAAILGSAHAGPIPSGAAQYQRELTRIVHQEWGLDGNVAVHAAQIHQESLWRTDARSHVGAAGLGQIMPATGEWLPDICPGLGAPAPYSPSWSMRGLACFDRWLYRRSVGHTECDRWWATLRAYNGGEGHWRAEARNAADPLDRHAVDAACGTARRSPRHCPENLGYPRRILLTLAPRYVAAGYPGGLPCTTP